MGSNEATPLNIVAYTAFRVSNGESGASFYAPEALDTSEKADYLMAAHAKMALREYKGNTLIDPLTLEAYHEEEQVCPLNGGLLPILHVLDTAHSELKSGGNLGLTVEEAHNYVDDLIFVVKGTDGKYIPSRANRTSRIDVIDEIFDQGGVQKANGKLFPNAEVHVQALTIKMTPANQERHKSGELDKTVHWPQGGELPDEWIESMQMDRGGKMVNGEFVPDRAGVIALQRAFAIPVWGTSMDEEEERAFWANSNNHSRLVREHSSMPQQLELGDNINLVNDLIGELMSEGDMPNTDMPITEGSLLNVNIVGMLAVLEKLNKKNPALQFDLSRQFLHQFVDKLYVRSNN